MADTADGVCDADCSLREAVVAANALAGVDTIDIPAGVYTITIAGRGENSAATGDFDLTDDVAINGADARTTIVDGAGLDRVFEFVAGSNSSLSDLTVRNGNPGSANVDRGGGILVGNMTVTLSNVTVTGNSTGSDGGGIDARGASTTIITNSTIIGNAAATGAGGGVSSQGDVTLTNVTISGNVANVGGGFNCKGNCTATNVTITANTASGDGGGIREQGGGAVLLANSIVANNTGNQECSATIVSLGGNLSSDASCSLTGPGDLPNTSPLLGPLQNNGGPTDTHELLVGSQAIDSAINANCPPTDQRGIARPVNVICDMGAYEFAATVPIGLVKRAFLPDGTPIPTGATIPNFLEFKYLLYINNTGVAASDVSVRDVLDAAFQYQAGTIKVDNSVLACALIVCTSAEELAIFTAVDAAAFLSDAVDGDVASYTVASSSVDAGNSTEANLQLDINADAVWAVLFSVKMP